MQGKGLVTRMMVGLALLTTATSVFAVMSIPYGWYAEANAGSTHLSKKSYPGSSSSSGLGANANVGYKFFPYVAAEVGYTQYAYTTIDAPNGNRAARDKHDSYDIAVKGIYPILTSGVEVFAKLGGSHIDSNVSIKNATAAQQIGIGASNSSNVNVYMGAGVQYYFIPEIAAVVQWQRANGTSSTATMDLFSGGLSLLVD